MSGRSMHRRATDADRRIGPSRLSQWSGARVAAVWLIWPAAIVVIILVAVLISIHAQGDASEVRGDFTRGNIIGLVLTAVVPPAYLTALWWRIRRRRRTLT